MTALSKAEQLAIAGAVAPKIRNKKERQRPIKVVDADGNVKGTVTHRDVLEGVARRTEIEITVVDGKRPAEVLCKDCRTIVAVGGRAGGIPHRCVQCKKRHQNEVAKRWYANNKSKAKAYYVSKRERAIAYSKEWAAKNRERRRELERSRRAAKRAAEKAIAK